MYNHFGCMVASLQDAVYCPPRVAKDHDLMTLRIPPDLMRRLERAAKHRRQSKNSLIQEFTLTAVAEIEESARLQKLPPLPPIGAQEASLAAPGESPGLGITPRITKKVQETEQVAAPVAPVVVQVGNTTPTSSTPGVSVPIGDLDRFAIYVVKGDDFMRDMRKRTAVEVLRCTASTDEEFKVLVARLEELVALKTKTVDENSGVNKLLQMGWDRLKNFLGEENG